MTDLEDTNDSTMLGLIFGLVAAGCMAGLAISTRSLKTIATSIILFWYCVGGMIMTGLYLIVELIVNSGNVGRFRSYSSEAYAFASASTLFDAASLCLITVAYQSDKSGFVALLMYLNIVWAYLADILLLDESLNVIEFMAALTILLIAISITFFKLRRQSEQE